jgi:DNA polymerase I-like protein with 3'-5' exonuclease and polymerase domains
VTQELPFREAVTGDFEFRTTPGGLPHVVCVVFRELCSGRELRFWRDDLLRMCAPPFDIERDVFVGFYTSAEISCFLQLGWKLPHHVIDLLIEHRCLTNGRQLKHERLKTASQSGKTYKSNGRDTLLNALAIRGLAHIDVDTKDAMRDLILSKEPEKMTPEERARILDYCASDVVGTEALLRYMLERNQLDWPRALWRGRYTVAVARMERVGVPLDVPLHQQLTAHWPALRHELIVNINQTFDVFDEHDSFKTEKFITYVLKRNLPWPKLPSGALALDGDTFDDMARFHPELRPLYEVRSSLGKMRLTGLGVGPDGRNRCLLSVFQTVTGRNAPSNSAFIFGPARWMRGLIKPPAGYGLAYVDWRSQEIAIAAALSGDEKLLAAYQSGDIYLAFARDAGLVPADATEESHGDSRDLCKSIVLGIGYGMGAESMAIRAGISVAEARNLLALHKHAYRKFWQWADSAIATALFTGQMTTKFGWRRLIAEDPNVRSIQNWPIQSHGAEMMRAAAIAATEVGLGIAAPIHDAFLLLAPLAQLDADVAALQAIMRAAGTAVIGIPVDPSAKIVRPPDRYMDKRGAETWAKIMMLLQTVQQRAAA